jgi:hypothetical protein
VSVADHVRCGTPAAIAFGEFDGMIPGLPQARQASCREVRRQIEYIRPGTSKKHQRTISIRRLPFVTVFVGPTVPQAVQYIGVFI